MRKEYDFSRGVRGRFSERVRSQSVRSGPALDKRRSKDSDPDDLSPSQIRELRRRVADLKDPVRYLVVSGFGRRFALYYNVSDDVYVMNNPSGGTLFKRRNAALAVKQLLGSGTRIIRCTTRRRNGVRVPVIPANARFPTARRRKGAA
jgi:hypothetical protein